jgi:hypothetical protein
MPIRNRQFACVLVAFGLCFITTARAEFTTINPTIHPNEDDHAEILSNIDGGTFVPVPAPPLMGPTSVDFTNGTLYAQRLHDRLTQNILGGETLLGGGGNLNGVDQLWRANFTIASAEAKFALFDQVFGYYDVDPSAEGGFQELFTVNGFGYDVDETADLSALAGRTIRWARKGGPDDPDPREFSSRESDNIDGADHMVSYLIQDVGKTAGVGDDVFTFLLFWEDKFLNEGRPTVLTADFDFNDLVVEVKALIPEPASGAILALAGAFSLRRRRAS